MLLLYFLITGLEEKMEQHPMREGRAGPVEPQDPEVAWEEDGVEVIEGLENVEKEEGPEEGTQVEIQEEEEELIPDLEEVLPEGMEEMQGEGDWQLDDGEEFFVEYRMYRDRMRSREIELLEDRLQDADATPESRQRAEEKLLEIVEIMENELIIENLLKARGYEEVLLFSNEGLATVILKTDELDREEAVQVSDLVAAAVGVEREEVKIFVQDPGRGINSP